MYHFWYNIVMADSRREPILEVVFYQTEAGHEPVRDWLKSLGRDDRKVLGEDIKTAQFGWPIGMSLIRKIEPNLWEVRTNLKSGIARMFFTVEGQTMVLLHGFVKKSQKTPLDELNTARRRLADLGRG
jgi:phage-related protein